MCIRDSNETGITDEDSDHSDWIEIKNLTSSNTNIGGWFLTDDESLERKWEFPSIQIPPFGRIIVYASGKDRSKINSELHTNFMLNSEGEYLALINSDGTTIAIEYNFPKQKTDISYGYSSKPIEEVLISSSTPISWFLPDAPINDWMSTNFNDESWSTGNFGIGFDTSDDYAPFFETDIKEQMRGNQTSVLVRSQFEITEPNEILEVALNIRYEDGFVAWINNQIVASRNSPELIQWNSRATSNRPDSEAVQKTSVNLEFDLGNFRKGTNTFAIQGLNRSPVGSDSTSSTSGSSKSRSVASDKLTLDLFDDEAWEPFAASADMINKDRQPEKGVDSQWKLEQNVRGRIPPG